jgi:hypothetical protein
MRENTTISMMKVIISGFIVMEITTTTKKGLNQGIDTIVKKGSVLSMTIQSSPLALRSRRKTKMF